MHIYKKVLFATVAGLWSISSLAHNDDLRSIKPEPRIGVMSEMVVREKLKTYGIKNVKSLKKVDSHYEITAEIDGKPTMLEMHALTGFLHKPGELQHIQPIGDASKLMIKPNIKLQRIDRLQLQR